MIKYEKIKKEKKKLNEKGIFVVDKSVIVKDGA